MHVLPECQRRSSKHRTLVEKVLKRLNTLIIAAHFGCFLIVVSEIAVSAKKTMESSFWFGDSFKLSTVIDEKTKNCTLMHSRSVAGYNAWDQEFSHYDREFKFAEFASYLNFAIGTNAAALLVGGINKVLFDINVFHIRIRHIRIRKDLVTTVELMLIAMSYIATSGIEPYAEALKEYLKSCGLRAESSLPFLPPFTALYIGLSITLAFHVLTFILMLKNSLKDRPKPGEVGEENLATSQHPAPFHSLAQSHRYSSGQYDESGVVPQ